MGTHELVNPFSESSSTPRKRPRLSIPDDVVAPNARSSTEMLTAQCCGPIGEVVRDDTYYMSDGSCIMRVEDTLFNVHRSILSKDNSSFGTMFTLPQGDHPSEGTSDNNPVYLPGDTADDFRHFLWALYALPHELMVVHTENANLAQLIAIANIANKYSFSAIQNWSLDAIQDLVNRNPSPILSHIPLSAKGAPTPDAVASCGVLLTRLVRLAQRCGHERLQSSMVTRLRQLMGLSLQFAFLAITLADELDLRPLRGVAYLEVMQKASVVIARPSPSSAIDGGYGTASQPGDIDSKGRLVVAPAQRLRLLSGYYNLTSEWERMRMKAPLFEHANSCGATWHQNGCTQSWNDFWKEKTKSEGVLGLGLADVLGRLNAISKEFDRWGSATYMHHDCRQAARKTISDKIKEIETALPDYFSDTV